MASNRAIDSQPRFEQLQQEVGVSNDVTKCLLERGYTTASDFAFSLPNAESLEPLIQGVMSDDQFPMGGILQNPEITDATRKIAQSQGAYAGFMLNARPCRLQTPLHPAPHWRSRARAQSGKGLLPQDVRWRPWTP